MALFENEYKNNLVTFGLDASPKLMTTLIMLNPEKIIISTNNDSSSDRNRGLESAVKIFIKLLKYFDIDALTIQPPLKNDFGRMHELNIDFDTWYNREPDKKQNVSIHIKLRQVIQQNSFFSRKRKAYQIKDFE